MTYNTYIYIYRKIPLFKSLVWGSLTLTPITLLRLTKHTCGFSRREICTAVNSCRKPKYGEIQTLDPGPKDLGPKDPRTRDPRT